MKEEYKKCLSMLKNIRENGFLCGPIFALKKVIIELNKKPQARATRGIWD